MNYNVMDKVLPHTYVAERRYRTKPELREAGIVHRLPDWIACNPCKTSYVAEVEHTPPQSSHDLKTFASLVTKTMNILRTRARPFATHEFFYSDVDRVW